MKKLIIIFGYNNTRIYDIERLKKLCRDTLGAEIMLCKEHITEVDKKITSNTLEINLTNYDSESLKQQANEIDLYLSSNNFLVSGCLPFSDKGIPLGSFYAKHKGLPHDDTDKAIACIDKYSFRCLEKEEVTPDWYKKPFFKKIHTLNEAENCICTTPFPLFFKPIAEGNSRGCIEINSIEDLKANIEIINRYLLQGILVEECIKNCDEYSFDGVDGNYIITEKKTSQGYYRTETQHVLPAPLDNHLYERLLEAGKIVSAISGSKNGAVHNELFINKQTGEVYCVEPNRRPAGLKLWDWINTAYPNIDNWKAWLNWATGKNNENELSNPQYYVGCRMLQSQKSGTIEKINHHIQTHLQKMNNVCDIAITKKVGQSVTNNLKDNSDFIGYIVCKSKTIDGLLSTLNHVENEANKIYKITG